jgi:hypothetical protein
MKKNNPKFIETFNFFVKTNPTGFSNQQKREFNRMLDKNEILGSIDTKHGVMVFGCKEQHLDECITEFKIGTALYKIRDLIDLIYCFGIEDNSNPYVELKDNYVETKLINRFPEQSQSVEDFIKKYCVLENEIKNTDWEYEDLFRNVLGCILTTEPDELKEGFRDSGIHFYNTWDDVDNSQKYGNIEYAIMFSGEIIGQLHVSGRWLGDKGISIYCEPSFFTGMFMKYFKVDESWLTVSKLDNVLNEFKTSEFFDKKYS